MKSLLLFLPHLLQLFYRLMADQRISKSDRAILVATVAYVLLPLDFMPDFIPFIGQVDDIYLVAIALVRLINRAPEKVVAQYWHGPGDIKQIVTTICEIAQMFLPVRIQRLLGGEIAPVAVVADIEDYRQRSETEIETALNN
jgi:uncharacterized membrane protein YkvA (DUF1232 family)